MRTPFITQTLTQGGSFTECVVVRDDLLPGGSKTRFLPHLLGDAKEIVFGGPFCGGAPVALAAIGQQLNRKVTLFYAKRKLLHKRQQTAQAFGAEIVWVPCGYMHVVQHRARNYAQRVGALFLPLGFDVAAAELPFVEAMRELRQTVGSFDEVWCASGSGMLARCLAKAFPESAVVSVAVGLRSRWSAQEFLPNVHVIESSFEYEDACKELAPFPACPNYERKAWILCREKAKGRVLFWNVIGD